MKFVLEIGLEDTEPFLVNVDSRDIRKWEATYEASWLECATSVTLLTQLAWLAARRAAQTNLEWQEFDDKCISIIRKDNDAENPTRRDHGEGP